MNNLIKLKTNEKGQTLLFVVVAVTIALTVGVAVSTRTIGSLRRVSRTDTSTRAIAVAEGGMENLLSKNYSQLAEAVSPGEAGCTAIGAKYEASLGCVYYFSKGNSSDDGSEEEPIINPDTGTGGDEECGKGDDCMRDTDPVINDVLGASDDKISTRAVVAVETFSTNNPDNGYSFNLDPGDVREVYLVGYGTNTINICWEEENTSIYYFSYNSDGEIKRGGLYANGSPIENDNLLYLGSFDEANVDKTGYGKCGEISLIDEVYGLRIKVLYSSSRVSVFPAGDGSLPDQGYKLKSKGEIGPGSGNPETATVIVHKTYPRAASIFDYGIYTPKDLGTN